MSTEAAFSLLHALLLTSGLATLLVLLLRRPLRSCCGARAAYALWWCVPAALLAVALPAPRTGLQETPTAMARMQTTLPAPTAVRADAQVWLLSVWSVGALAMAGVLLGRQRRFVRGLGRLDHGAEGLLSSAANVDLPVALGLWRPRIVLPHDFIERFTPDERRLVLAHERVHLRRGDLWANTLAAMVQCLHWFNPVMYGAMRRFRLDQELACDALVLARAPGARRTYGSALLKTLVATSAPAPLTCHWPARHPLAQRIVMLGHRPPGRVVGSVALTLSLSVALATGYAAWAQQPARNHVLAAPQAFTGLTREVSAKAYAQLSPPRYPVEALSQGVSGKVVLRVDVDAHGNPARIRVESSEPTGMFDRSVLEAAAQWRFEPALRNGEAVAGQVRVPVTFDAQMQPVAAPAAYAKADYAWYRLGWDGPPRSRLCDRLLPGPEGTGALCGIAQAARR